MIGVEGSAPPLCPLTYSPVIMRRAGRSPTTTGAHPRAIVTARRWTAERRFSLKDRMRSGPLLAGREVVDPARVLCLSP